MFIRQKFPFSLHSTNPLFKDNNFNIFQTKNICSVGCLLVHMCIVQFSFCGALTLLPPPPISFIPEPSRHYTIRSDPLPLATGRSQHQGLLFAGGVDPPPGFFQILLESRAGNSHNGFLSESLVFWEKMSQWAIRSKKQEIRSFLVSDLSDSFMVAHFWWATWANCSWSLIFGEQPERFAHIAHFWWATWAIHSHRSPKKREWVNCSFF